MFLSVYHEEVCEVIVGSGPLYKVNIFNFTFGGTHELCRSSEAAGEAGGKEGMRKPGWTLTLLCTRSCHLQSP